MPLLVAVTTADTTTESLNSSNTATIINNIHNDTETFTTTNKDASETTIIYDTGGIVNVTNMDNHSVANMEQVTGRYVDSNSTALSVDSSKTALNDEKYTVDDMDLQSKQPIDLTTVRNDDESITLNEQTTYDYQSVTNFQGNDSYHSVANMDQESKKSMDTTTTLQDILTDQASTIERGDESNIGITAGNSQTSGQFRETEKDSTYDFDSQTTIGGIAPLINTEVPAATNDVRENLNGSTTVGSEVVKTFASTQNTEENTKINNPTAAEIGNTDITIPGEIVNANTTNSPEITILATETSLNLEEAKKATSEIESTTEAVEINPVTDNSSYDSTTSDTSNLETTSVRFNPEEGMNTGVEVVNTQTIENATLNQATSPEATTVLLTTKDVVNETEMPTTTDNIEIRINTDEEIQTTTETDSATEKPGRQNRLLSIITCWNHFKTNQPCTEWFLLRKLRYMIKII